jgi:hypothetical protein
MALLVPYFSFKFSFLPGATAPATPATEALYTVKFPQGKGSFKPGVDIKDVVAPVGGANRLIGSAVTKAMPEYEITLPQIDKNVLSLLLGGPAIAVAPPTTIAVGTQYVNNGWGFIAWYNLGDAVGTPLFSHYGFTCAVLPNGDLSGDPETPGEVKLRIRVLDQAGTFA